MDQAIENWKAAELDADDPEGENRFIVQHIGQFEPVWERFFDATRDPIISGAPLDFIVSTSAEDDVDAVSSIDIFIAGSTEEAIIAVTTQNGQVDQ